MDKQKRIQAIESILKEAELETPEGEAFTCSNALGFQKTCITQLATMLEEAMEIDSDSIRETFKTKFKEQLNIYTIGDMLNDDFSLLATAISTNKEVIKING